VSEKDPNRVIAFAEACCKAIRAPIAFNEREISLTASLGVALLDTQPDEADELIKNAELAMYAAKRCAATASKYSSPPCGRARPIVESGIRAAPRAQPRRDRDAVIGDRAARESHGRRLRALARWDHPKMGRLSPFEFVAMVEEIGLMADLGLFAIERAARQLAMWQRAARSRVPLFASVSVSSRQLLKNDVVESLRAVLGRGSLARGTLKLELTESAVMENPEQAAQILKRLRDFGAGLALNDFGTGHSSLAYLPRFPFDTIKIDRSFVRANAKGTRPVVLRSMVGLAHDLGMDVVAEGAENEADAVELYHLGCEFAQGLAFGRPMSADQAQDLVLGKRLGISNQVSVIRDQA